MFFRILKKDLKNKKTMNVIILLFIIMSTMFLASSVNNLVTISNAVDYYLDLAKAPDYLILSFDKGENEEMEKFLENEESVKDFEMTNGIVLDEKNISIKRADSTDSYSSIYEIQSILGLFGKSKNYMKVFDQNGNPFKLEQGEVAIPYADAMRNHIKKGDQIVLSIEGKEKTFLVTIIMKDAVLGSDMMGFKRLIICDEDLKEFTNQDKLVKETFYAVDLFPTLEKDFYKAFGKENFLIITSLPGSTIKSCYIMEMLMAAILILVSICLILIAFLILRFTIIFSIQESYKEIGIMKALGIKVVTIKKIYLVKYFVIAFIGSVIGFILSFPFGMMLIKQAIQGMLVEDARQNVMINCVCALLIIGIVILFCYASTNKLNKFSAMEAIRNGSNGERYHGRRFLKLHRMRSIKLTTYLAMNDILSNLKRYLVLFFTFFVGSMLISLPLIAISTLQSEKVLQMFGIMNSDFYVDDGQGDTYFDANGKKNALAQMSELEKEFSNKGYSVTFYSEFMYNMNVYANKEESKNIVVLQVLHSKKHEYDMIVGSEPIMENEIALTEITANRLGVSVGDTVFLDINNKEMPFLVTGLYQSMIMLGENARLNDKFEINMENFSGVYSVQADFIEKMSPIQKEKSIKKIKEQFPEYDIYNGAEFAKLTLGGTVEQISGIKSLIVILVSIINAMITILMMKTIMSKESSEIALLKSIGFKNLSIQIWQMKRVILVLIAAIVSGVVVSRILAPKTIGLIFAYMGANRVKLSIVPSDLYLKYPLVLLVVTMVSSIVAAHGINSVDLKEVNNLE